MVERAGTDQCAIPARPLDEYPYDPIAAIPRPDLEAFNEALHQELWPAVQGDNGSYARAFGSVPDPQHCPFCWATEPECIEEPVLNTTGSGGNDPDNNGAPGLWYCWNCNREIEEDDLDRPEPADHQDNQRAAHRGQGV